MNLLNILSIVISVVAIVISIRVTNRNKILETPIELKESNATDGEFTLNVARDFSRFPAGRYKSDSNASGEEFRARINNLLQYSFVKKLTIEMDGTLGYSSVFLSEAFGGLVKVNKFHRSDLQKRLNIVSSNKSLVGEIWLYILTNDDEKII